MWFGIGFGGACFLCVYFLESALYIPALISASLLLAGCIGFYTKWHHARLPAVILFGVIVGMSWMILLNAFYYDTARSYDGQSGYLSVLVTDHPKETQYGFMTEGKIYLDGKPYKVNLYLAPEEKAQLGDTVTGYFSLRSCLSGGSHDVQYNRANGVFLIVSGGKNVRINRPDSLPLSCYPAKIRLAMTELLGRIFPENTLAFARALLLGDTDAIDFQTDWILKVSGIMHVVSVSGMHVSILFGLVYILTGRKRLLVALLGIPVLFLFSAIVGFGPSVTRACLMHGIMVLSMFTRREYDAPTSLSFAVLLMLLSNPYNICNISFQLSVGCMVGMIAFADPIRNWLLNRRRLGKFKCRKIMSGIATSVGISIGASIVTAPLSALYFGMVSLIGVVTNLLTLWMLTYVFYGIMAAAAFAIVFEPLGICLAWLSAWGIRYTLCVAEALARVSFAAVFTDSIYIVFWLVLVYLLLAVFILTKKKHPTVFGCCATVGLILAMLLSWSEPLTDECRVTVLDVGQGQCILLQSSGKNYLVDCGGNSDESAARTAARRLLSQGINRLDGVIVTHYDRDHAGGVELLMSIVPADALYLPIPVQEDTVSDSLVSNPMLTCYTVSAVQKISYADTSISLIPPKAGNDDNESGLCILFQTKNCDILITGDRNESGERELMADLELPRLELLIGGHHGSKYSTCDALLEATRPEYVFFSVGFGNPYGHPAPEVLERIRKYGCVYYRTDLYGTIIYRG